MRNNQDGFSLTSVLLIVLVIGSVIFTGIYVNKNITDRESVTSSTPQPAAAENQEPADEPKKDNYPVNGFATGPVVFRDDAPDYFEVRMKSSVIDQPVKALWVEYGDSPVVLNNKTREVTDELGLGGDVYGSWLVVMQEGSFNNGGTYFYRAVARLQDNSLIYGGIVAFDAPK